MYTKRIHRYRNLIPSWATPRSGDWKFAGWIDRKNVSKLAGRKSFDELVERAKQSDHGEEIEVDIYKQGAVCWRREKDSETS